MARLVMGLGVPHGPMLPKQVAEEGASSETGAHFAKVREQLEAARPDVLVVFDTDHFVNFFFDNMPAMCIGMVDQAEGPDETRVEMPHYTVPIHEAMGRSLFEFGLNAEFDLSSREEMTLDHSVLVPLHFLTPKMDIPIVPVYIRALTPPLPLSRRCHALGRMVREFIANWPGDERVAVLASGSFSLEVGGPRIGRTDHLWMDTVVGSLRDMDVDGLLKRATTERMVAAGNVSGELLNWIAMLGSVGQKAPTFVDPQEGHAFAVWHLE